MHTSRGLLGSTASVSRGSGQTSDRTRGDLVMSDEDRRLHQRKEHSRSRRSFFEDPTHFQSSDEIYQSGHQAPLPSKKKPKKKITPILHDVYIPHLISVENLSRLLNIRLGSSSPIY